jgi:protein O-mannosyl-transferase
MKTSVFMPFSRFYSYIVLSIAVLLTVLAYLPGLHGPFAFDDVTSIVQNRALAIHSLAWDQLTQAMLSSDTGPMRRPLSMLSFALNVHFNGLDPTAFKITNLVIHLLNGVLIFALLHKIAQYWQEKGILQSYVAAFWLPLLCASAWLLHPLNLTAVLYVVQRETSLCSLFILAGCLCYVHARLRMQADKSGWWWLYIGILVNLLLAILSKETGLLLPVYLLVIELCVFRFSTGNIHIERGLFIFFGLFLLLPLCLGLVWIFGIHHGAPLSYAGRDFTLSERLLTETRVVWDYIRWTLFPRLPDLGLYHDDIPLSTGLLSPLTTLFSILGLVALLATAGFTWKKRPWIAFGILWFFAGQLLESTVWPLEIAFEHRNYLADMGILIALFGFILTEHSRLLTMRFRIGILFALVITYGAVTGMRAYVWRSTLSLVKTQAANHPQSPYATYALGQELTNLVLAGEKQLIPEAEAALAHSASLPNSGIIPGAALALLESQTSDNNDPENFKRMAKRLRTHAISSSDQQGITSLVQCQTADNCHFPPSALQSLFDAALANPRIRENPGVYANILTDYGNFLSQGPNSNLHKSRDLMQQAADLVPSVAQYRINVVTVDIALGDPSLARQDLQKVVALNRLGNLNPVIADLNKQINDLEAASAPSLVKKPAFNKAPASATHE